jgi:hypothetical protein
VKKGLAEVREGEPQQADRFFRRPVLAKQPAGELADLIGISGWPGKLRERFRPVKFITLT